MPKRFDELSEFGNYANEIGHAVRSLIGRKARKNAVKIEDLENRQGGVVEKDGELLGAYRGTLSYRLFLFVVQCCLSRCQSCDRYTER